MSKYTITGNYGMMPNQIHGTTDDGQYFYFRGRHGRWQLHFGATADEAIDGPGYEGEEKSAGWFEKDEWEAFFWQVIELVESGKATPLDWDRHEKDMDDLLVRLMTPATPQDIAEFLDALQKKKVDDE